MESNQLSACEAVVFSSRAYNAIISETAKKHPVETGGILLGYVLNNGIWVVMEAVPPGPKSIFEHAYFEYDVNFVNYIANDVAQKYLQPLQLLGIWHRHPGSMDVFSSTDDVTNATFARLNGYGAISALVNVDPNFRITMRHVEVSPSASYRAPKYKLVDVASGDDLIPSEYFKMRFFNDSTDVSNPKMPTQGGREETSVGGVEEGGLEIKKLVKPTEGSTDGPEVIPGPEKPGVDKPVCPPSEPVEPNDVPKEKPKSLWQLLPKQEVVAAMIMLNLLLMMVVLIALLFSLL